jgi:23S rRNA G2445 N2-methylase RlmL
MRNPEVIVFVYLIEDECFIGIDFCGRDLSKREYKIFNNPYSIRPAIGHAIGRIAEINADDVILDPFCGTGEITIEAALFLTKMSPNFYCKNDFVFRKMPQFKERDFDEMFKNIDAKQKDLKLRIHAFDHQMRNMTAAKKNAKIAGINKQIHIARVDTDWIELKLEEGSVDKIITRLPSIPKDDKAKIMMKVIDDFFYQAEFVLKEKGRIVAMVQKKEGIEEPMKKYGFSKIDEREVWQGKEKHWILVMEK